MDAAIEFGGLHARGRGSQRLWCYEGFGKGDEIEFARTIWRQGLGRAGHDKRCPADNVRYDRG